MTERLQSIEITITIDTNKATYRQTFADLPSAVAWWNGHAEELRLGTFAIHEEDE